mmetsp:Transcript_28524/g.82606  ORF Transcript_28524/g.82606 Transcript_28524/m.82606 type:complete len:304 (+) Transcript_28524:258-1169(+)
MRPFARELLEGHVSPRADGVAHALARLPVLRGASVQIFSPRREEARDPEARTIEFANDPRAPVPVDWDEVCRPQRWQLFHLQPERRHDCWDLAFELLPHLGELRCVWLVDGRHCLAAHAANVDVMLDPEDLHAHQQEPNLALGDPGQKALVDHLTTSLSAALEVPARPDGLPLTRLLTAAVHAEVDELREGVLLAVVVARLGEDKHLIIGALALAEGLAIFAGLQFHDPNALPAGATVLLHHPRLERDVPPENGRHVLRGIVGRCVLEAEVHVLDFAKRILGAHFLHHIRGRPYIPSLRQLHH